MDKPSASDAHSPKATANTLGVYGHHTLSMGGRGSNGSALARTDPIEHTEPSLGVAQAESANRNEARGGFG
jgi:hypothetical protein